MLAFFYECVRTYNKNISFFFDLLKLNTKRLFKTSRSQDTVKQLKEEFKIFMANDVLRCVDVIELNMKDILVSVVLLYYVIMLLSSVFRILLLRTKKIIFMNFYYQDYKRY